MKVILAGATGLIGRALVPALLADGHTVTVLTRGADPVVSGAPAVRWDGLRVDETPHRRRFQAERFLDRLQTVEARRLAAADEPLRREREIANGGRSIR